MHQFSRKLFVVAEKEIEQAGKVHSVKFMFSEKATKYKKNISIFCRCKKHGRSFRNFVAFSENINFNDVFARM